MGKDIIEQVSNEEIQAIRQKTPTYLSNRPNQEGFSPQYLKDIMAHTLLDKNKSILALINRIISGVNDTTNILRVEESLSGLSLFEYANKILYVKSNKTLYSVDDNGNAEVININNRYIAFSEEKGIIHLRCRNPQYFDTILSDFTIESDGIYYLEGKYIGSGEEDKYKVKLVDNNDLMEVVESIKLNTAPYVVIDDALLKSVDYYSLISNNEFYESNRPLVYYKEGSNYHLCNYQNISSSLIALQYEVSNQNGAKTWNHIKYEIKLYNGDSTKNTITSNSMTMPSKDSVDSAIDTLTTNTNPTFKDVSVSKDNASGEYTITFTSVDDSKTSIKIDTPVEKIIDVENPPYLSGNDLILTFVDGTKVSVDMTNLVEYNTFSDTKTISITQDENHNVTATLIDGGVTRVKLSEDIQKELDKLRNDVTDLQNQIGTGGFSSDGTTVSGNVLVCGTSCSIDEKTGTLIVGDNFSVVGSTLIVK